ncbi:MAG TPA: phage tail length tape measure family protein, partial [Ktedonobacterales bacterium]
MKSRRSGRKPSPAVAGGVYGVTQGVRFLADTVGGFVDAASQAQAVSAQTNAVLASTHGISGQTAQSMADLAGNLMHVSGADDDAIQSAENLIATFTNIRGDNFQGTTKAVLDMATAMNGGAVPSAEQLRQTALQVGKALQDPTEGVSALQRVGVKLTDQQLAQVKALQANGDMMGAQKIILGELSNEFGGSAASAGQTFAGKMSLLHSTIGNLQENIGGKLIPVLTNLVTAVTPAIEGFG